MTTKVTIEPAGHEIEVASIDITGNATREILPSSSLPRVFYIHSHLELSIREVPTHGD